MNLFLSPADKRILRDLAWRQAEIAALPVMQERRRLWTAHNDLRSDVPMIFFEAYNIRDPDYAPQLLCEGEAARAMESAMRWAIFNHEYIGDDQVVTAEYICPWNHNITALGIPVTTTGTDGIGFHIDEQLQDLTTDMEKVGPSTVTLDRDASLVWADFVRETLGDILEVRMGSFIAATMTNQLVHHMGMENMFMAMLDTPDEFHQVMELLTEGYERLYDGIEQQGMLTPNNGNDRVCQGTFGFSDSLPATGFDPQHCRLRDLWGYMDSQETVGISPAMFGEFIFPYYQRILKKFGLVVYGCCEPVHPLWDDYLSRVDNIRKVSISAWCDEAFMGERLRGSRVIYQRKPSPNFVGVGERLDEDAFRSHIVTTIEAAKGCRLEITFRDVYTLSGHHDKPRRAVEIVREELARRW